MPFEHKINRGSLFKNHKKTDDRHPEYKGEINFEGELYEVGAWIKEGSKGKFFSLSVKLKGSPAQEKLPLPVAPIAPTDPDDDIPF